LSIADWGFIANWGFIADWGFRVANQQATIRNPIGNPIRKSTI